MRIAAYQMQIAWENKEENFRRLEKKLREASEKQVDLLLLPEMSFTGFSMNTELTKEANQETVEKVKSLAAAYGMAIGFGWVLDCGEKCENHYTVVSQYGEILSDYAKIHPFSYSGEDEKFVGGEKLSAFRLQGIPFSTFICYDLRFPELFQCVSQNAHILLVPANWPAKRSHHWKSLLQARAIENQAYLIGINCVGMTGKLYYSGDSCMISPDGEILQELHDEEGLLVYDLTDDVESYRAAFPVKKDRRTELYQTFWKDA